MISIYHKSNCSTSLAALKILKDSGKKHKIILYLENPLNLEQLQELQGLLQVPAETIVHKKEPIYKKKYTHKKLKKNNLLSMI